MLSTGLLRLDQLPEAIADLHEMPPDLAVANMRLLRIASLQQWASLKVYEDVVASDCLELPYSSVSEQQWATTLVLSWRWGLPKPMPHSVPGFSPMTPAQWSELCNLLANAARSGIEFAWVDWSCVPQYGADSMVEVLRSKVFYARAASMVILTTFEELPGSGSVRLMLRKALRELQKISEQDPESKFVEQLVALTLQAMLDKGIVASREYFGRAWTLAERGESGQQQSVRLGILYLSLHQIGVLSFPFTIHAVARYGRQEGLHRWISLEAWLGMVVDAMLKSEQGRLLSHSLCFGNQSCDRPHTWLRHRGPH